MQVAIVSTCPEPWGGSEELWFDVACRLRAAGHDVAVLKLHAAGDHPRLRELQSIGCTVRELSPGRTYRPMQVANVLLPKRYELDPRRRELLVLGALLAARRPRVVVISQGQNFDGVHLASACRLLRLPYVLISHKTTELHWPRDEIRHYWRRAFKRSSLCVFVSEHNRRLTEDQLGISLEDALICRNPVAVGNDGPLSWPQADGELRLACVGRLNIREKGQDLLLRVLAQPTWRERPVSLAFFGEGLHHEALTDLAERLGSPNVTFEGQHLSIEEVWRRHHLLVLPSREEGLPIALVEAMMCGRPALVTDVGGNREVIDDGVTGFIAAAPAVTTLGAALEQAWQRRDQLEEMGTAAASRIRTLFADGSRERLVERVLGIAARG